MAWEFMWIFAIVSAALCAIGFYKYVYFLSVGYGLSVAGLGVAYFVVLAVNGYDWNFVTFLQCILFVIYGARLSGFLIAREVKNLSYRKVLKEATKEGEKPMPFFVKFAIWVCVAVLLLGLDSDTFYIYHVTAVMVDNLRRLLLGINLSDKAVMDFDFPGVGFPV